MAQNRSARSGTKKIQKLLRQQEALARFGKFAFREENLPAILTEAARACAESLDVRYCKVLKHRVRENDLLVEAGVGWQPDVVGRSISQADASSPGGRAFVTREPVITEDLRKDHDFTLPRLYADHAIVSSINVIIHSTGEAPYGVLEIDSEKLRHFDEHDIDFLQGFANVLAEAVATRGRLNELRTALGEKDAAIAERDLLARELQHRVRNNLQVVLQLLLKQSRQATDDSVKRRFDAVAQRVMTLAQVHDHLLTTGISRTTDFGGYLKSLCAALEAFHAETTGDVKLACNVEPVTLDLERTTTLGLIVSELVANAYEHAFSGKVGRVDVILEKLPDNQKVMLVVSDTGSALKPDTQGIHVGLGLIRRLAQKIGGSVETRSDRGTRVAITFPV
jgi:two-component sensor histidine kinase